MKKKKHLLIKSIFLFSTMFIFNFSSAQVMFQKDLVFAYLHETKQTADSGFISVGWWSDVLSSNHQYACLIKTNYLGDTIWTRMYGQSNDVVAYSLDITNDGGYVLAGYTYSPSSKVYLIRTDQNGDTLWTRKFGGANNEYARCVRKTFDGGFIISGGTGSLGPGISDIYIIKTDSNGIVEWSKTFGGSNHDISYAISQTADSGYLAIGVLNAFMANCDIVLIKMNSIGDTLWTKSYGGPSQDFAFGLTETFDHGFAIIGNTTSFSFGRDQIYLLVTDSIGNLLFSKGYGGTGFAHGAAISQTADSGYVISGYTDSFGATTWAHYIIKLNAQGDTIWSKTYDNLNYGTTFSIKQTFDGGYVTAGKEYELMKLDSNGSSGCLEKSVATIITNLPTMLLNNPLSDSTPSTISFPPSTIVRSGIGIFTICTSVGLNEITSGNNSIQVFPNPSSGKFTITFSDLINKGFVKIYNLFGEQLFEEDIFDVLKAEINLKYISSGVYCVKVFDGEKYYCKKIIVE